MRIRARHTGWWLVKVVALLTGGGIVLDSSDVPILSTHYVQQIGLLLVIGGLATIWLHLEPLGEKWIGRLQRRVRRARRQQLTPVQIQYRRVMHLDDVKEE